jgi:adenosine deaminase
MLDLANEAGIALPASRAEELRAAMEVPPHEGLVGYLNRFSTTIALLQTPEALERAAYELAVDAAEESVCYLEVRYSPGFHVDKGMSLDEAVAAPLRGLARAESEVEIQTGLILCGIRSLPPEASLAMAELAVSWKDRGVVAFDLAGAEGGHPAEDHVEAFHLAAENNVAITIHAGEGDGPDSISQALHRCHARRIGHGTRLAEDPSLEAFVNDHRVPLEMCLTSNVQTGASPSVAEHPFRHYFDAGLVVTLNTDNRLMSGVDLTEEYWLAHEHLGFSWEELKEVALMGFRSAFLPYQAKVNLLDRMESEIQSQ